MAIAAPPKPRFLTLADVIARVGNVPPERIMNNPAPGTATEQDVLNLDVREDILCELVDGILVRKPMGFMESRLAVELIQLLGPFIAKDNLGVVADEAGMLRLTTGLVRIPDVSVILWESIPGGELPNVPIPDIAPDLAVEVLSESNTDSEISQKLKEYFSAGTRLAWIIDSRTRTAKAYTSPDRFSVLTQNETLEGGDVLPGFTLSLKTLFDRAPLRKKPD